MSARISKQERAEALARLARIIKPGDRVFTSIKHVARSGMSRSVAVYVIDPSGKDILNVTWNVAAALGYGWDNARGAIRMGGCGFDAGFHVVYYLGRALFPEGGDVTLSCRRHQEEREGNTTESNGGYLLVHGRL